MWNVELQVGDIYTGTRKTTQFYGVGDQKIVSSRPVKFKVLKLSPKFITVEMDGTTKDISRFSLSNIRKVF